MNDISKVIISYQLTHEDYIEAKQINVFKRPGLIYKMSSYLLAITIPFFGIVYLIRINNPNFMIIQYFQSSNNYSTSYDNLFWGLLLIITGLPLLFSEICPKYDLLTRWKISRAYKKNFVIQQPRKVEINEVQIRIVLDSYREIRSWKNYIKFVESSKMFLLYYDKEEYQIIPKRAFNPESDINLFRNLLQNKITK